LLNSKTINSKLSDADLLYLIHMKRILIINGPNLNLLGKREPGVYGNLSFETYFETLKSQFESQFELTYYQSNVEGELINKIHEVGFDIDGIIINAGAYTHTSIAIADAIRAVTTTVVEVHISNTHQRDTFRHHSYLSAAVKGVILGFGMDSYRLAIQSFL
jgi:3-dehydroquinate dehydratase-2